MREFFQAFSAICFAVAIIGHFFTENPNNVFFALISAMILALLAISENK